MSMFYFVHVLGCDPIGTLYWEILCQNDEVVHISQRRRFQSPAWLLAAKLEVDKHLFNSFVFTTEYVMDRLCTPKIHMLNV